MSDPRRLLSTFAVTVAAAVAVAQPAFATPADFRSPGARVAHAGVSPAGPTIQIIRSSPSSSFDWGDAGIGAGGAIAVVLVALGGVTLAGHRRREVGRHSALAG